ncbi:hypothetical protein D3C71_1534720 [compost metagenome]
MDQRIHVQLHRIAVVVHQIQDRIELVDRVDRVGLAGGFRAAGAAGRRQQREVRVGVLLHQKEFQLRRHHRAKAEFGVGIEHPPQHVARGQLMRLAMLGVAVVDDLRGGIGGPGHHAHGVRIRAQDHVRVRRRGEFVVVVGEITGDGGGEDALGQARAVIVGKLVGRNDLAACIAGDVRHQALHLGDAALLEPAQQRALLRHGRRRGPARGRGGFARWRRGFARTRSGGHDRSALRE